MAYYGGGNPNRGNLGQMNPGRGQPGPPMGHMGHPGMGRGGGPQPGYFPTNQDFPRHPDHSPSDAQYSRARVVGDPLRNQGPFKGPGGPPQNTDYFLDAGDMSSSTRNDCEIILYGREQLSYAEVIEQTIRGMGLRIDIMFPKKESKVAPLLEPLNEKGTFFAIVIRPDNEKHQSVSVHVLKGVAKPEEHRNMPVKSAYTLIKDRFQLLKAKEVGYVPPQIKSLLRFLIDDKPLTDIEYGTLIFYLNGRRRKAAGFEGNSEFEDVVGKQLQGRILKILGCNGDESVSNLQTPSKGPPGVGMGRRGGGNISQGIGRGGFSPY